MNINADLIKINARSITPWPQQVMAIFVGSTIWDTNLSWLMSKLDTIFVWMWSWYEKNHIHRQQIIIQVINDAINENTKHINTFQLNYFHYQNKYLLLIERNLRLIIRVILDILQLIILFNKFINGSNYGSQYASQ